MNTASGAASPLLVTRIIGIALAAGVTAFAIVAWWVQRQAGGPAGGEHPWLLIVWAGTAVTLCAVSILLWRNNVEPLTHTGHHPAGPPPAGRAAAIQTGAITSWALVEAAALFGVVVYFLEGIALAALAGVALMWAALALSWPQPEWFERGKT